MNKRQKKKALMRVGPDIDIILYEAQEESCLYPCLENMDRKRLNGFLKAALLSGEFTLTTPPHLKVECYCDEYSYWYTIWVPSRLPGSRETKSSYKRRWKRAMHRLCEAYKYDEIVSYESV